MMSRRCLLLAAFVAAMLSAAASVAEAQQRPSFVRSCFVKNCAGCSARNPYVCTQCNAGYRLTAAGGCNSCDTNYEQNLEERSFTCTACPPGTGSPGGTGEASQCKPISVTSGRRLYGQDQVDEALWA